MSLGSQICDCTFLTKRTRRWSRGCFFNFFLPFVTVVHPPLAPDPVTLAQLGCTTGASGGCVCLLDVWAVPLEDEEALFPGGVEMLLVSCLSVCNTVITSFMSCLSWVRSFLISSTSARKDRASTAQVAAAKGSLGTLEALAMRSLIVCMKPLSCTLKVELISVFRFLGLNGPAAYVCCSSQLCDPTARNSRGEGKI